MRAQSHITVIENKEGGYNIMKTLRKIGLAGLASAAFLALTPSLTVAATPEDSADKSSTVVHRISHKFASTEQYTGSTTSGYKWGSKAPAAESKAIWAGDNEPRAGYKWGNSGAINNANQTADFTEQTRSRWRRDFTEQTRSRWRRDFTEQTRSRWRRDFTEQTRSRWRRDFTEQTRSRWRRDFSEQL
jgi:hypothetical protein